MMEPLPCRCMCGSTYLQHRYTEVRLTSWTRRQASSPVVRMVSSSGGEMPALLNATSIRPCRSTTPSNRALTCSSLATSATTKSPPVSLAAAEGARIVAVDIDEAAATAAAKETGESETAASTGDHNDPILQALH